MTISAGQSPLASRRKSNVPRPPRDPFDLKLDDDQRKALAVFLCEQIQNGLDARSSQDAEVDYWWTLYEQARTRLGRNAPWPDAADLTSYLASEKVDALHARILRALWSDPVWTVEGWGEAAARAPFVEEFHQWKVEEERLQGVLDKLALQALVEPRGLLEIAEGTEMRTVRKRITAKVETDPLTGGMVFDEKGPALQTKPDGTYQEAGPNDPGAETVMDVTDRVRTGPVYRILPYRDSVILPGHARDAQEIWGYGKRFWRTIGDLTRQAEAGRYDVDAIDRMSTVTDRETDAALKRARMDVAPQDDPSTAEKELWELLILLDLNLFFESRTLKGLPAKTYNGARWFLTTVHLPTQQLLRVQHDDLERSRFVPVILFPRSDRATEGYSFVGHKLITTIEEHTAWRNMAADRASMVAQAPIKRLTGALWDPEEQPWGPKAVIDVRDMRELEPVAVPDLTSGVFTHIEMMERTADRLSGVNDVASGQVATDSRTLGEIQMATEQSFVRMDLVVRRFQEAMEDIAQIRHAILKRMLAEQPDGITPPASMLSSLEGRGVSIDEFLPDQKVTAELLEGAFRFKPHGSVETADPNRLRADFVSGLQALGPLMQAFPALAAMFQTPQAARAMGRQFLRVFRVPNAQAFLGSPAQDLQQQLMAQLMPILQGQAAPLGGAPSGLPMGNGPTSPGAPAPGPLAPGVL